MSGPLVAAERAYCVRANVEIPSDLYGVIYIELDGYEGWKRRLAGELKAAGLKINTDI
jgi:hypothetical protein